MYEVFKPYTKDGWQLDVKRFVNPRTLVPGRRPIVMVPGYCMNTFILSYHPRGTSMVGHLVDQGFEVWTANLRGQGDSRLRGGNRRYGFQHLALNDFPLVRDLVLEETRTGAEMIDAVGCSLGATVLYTYLATYRDDHRVGAMVNIGGPLRWDAVHPLVRALLYNPSLAASFPVRGTRHLARAALPVLEKVPAILSLYMNPSLIDMTAAAELVKTVDDPCMHLTRQIAHWVKKKDLVVDGLNITHALREVDIPILCILASHDGIVPPKAALSILDHVRSEKTNVFEIGDARLPYAHADLFISNEAVDKVFDPLAKWLESNYDAA
jgi:pimeloyl-ACP methyl ester carboxylesterase